MLLYEIIDLFDKEKLKYAIVGGYALALHGIVRATMDVDLVLNLTEEDYVQAERILKIIGLESRLPVGAEEVIRMRKEYIRNRNLIAWSFVDYANPSRQVDLLITKDLRKLETVKISVGGRKIVVASLREILAMKIESGRPQDIVDIQHIREKMDAKKK